MLKIFFSNITPINKDFVKSGLGKSNKPKKIPTVIKNKDLNL
jgi:hypothetical protein